VAGGMLGACPRSHFTLAPISLVALRFLQGRAPRGWLVPQQVRQLDDVGGDPPRLVGAEQLTAGIRLTLLNSFRRLASGTSTRVNRRMPPRGAARDDAPHGACWR
jgi:hypothetical protein